MRSLSALLVLAVLCCSALAEDNDGDTWAVVVAGSEGWWNYGQQSTAYHAYHLLIDHGVDPDKVITVLYDDLADDFWNPFPGQVFNEPGGSDVYEGVKFDYSGSAVNKGNFKNILKGRADLVKGGNGKVLKSGKNDKVFVYFVDHGDGGIICFPTEVMTAQELNETLEYMHENELYGQLVFYLETCESGSMFDGILPDNYNILAVTAANASELAWQCFCDDPNMNTCLACCMGLSFIHDSESRENLLEETILEQFEIVHNETLIMHDPPSHVSKYGDLSILPAPVGHFQGRQIAKPKLRSQRRPTLNVNDFAKWTAQDAPVRMWESRIRNARSPAQRAQFERELRQLQKNRAFHDQHTRALFARLVNSEVELDYLLNERLGPIRDLACHNDVVLAYHERCFNLGKNTYALKAVAPLANLCQRGVSAEEIIGVIHQHCSHASFVQTII